MKGGKSGKLLVPGQPEASLLLKRLGLPLEDKKHMPPSGKPQLTSHEQTVLYAWIKAGAPFHTRIATMEATDTFRVAAASFLQGDAPQEVFTFSAAEPEILQRLNSNYRVVVPVAKHSPALAVNV